MTTAEALDSIPALVEKTIPMKFDFIKCSAQRAAAIANARFRRNELDKALRIMVLRLQDYRTSSKTGLSVDLLEDEVKRFCVVTFDSNDEQEAIQHAQSLNSSDVFVLDRIEENVVLGREENKQSL